MRGSKLLDGRDFVRIVSTLEGLGYCVTSIDLERIQTNYSSSEKFGTGATLIRIVPVETDEQSQAQHDGFSAFCHRVGEELKSAGALK